MTQAADLLHYLPIIVRSPISDWERKFCISIIARQKRGPFTPTQGQGRVIVRLVEDFKAKALRDDDAPLIEGARDGDR